MNQQAETVLRYHRETKHHYQRYARSSGYMDWRNQPNPFRLYEGIEPVRLPLLSRDPDAGYLHLYRRSTGEPRSFSIESVAAFLELSLGLSAWKAIGGSRWSLRMNPSSGNLHPTECHLILPQMPGLSAGVCHYVPLLHALEQRAGLPPELRERIRDHFGTDVFLAGLSSIFWRESWKYGERAFRYCNHDVGHAIAALGFAAGLQGWNITCLTGLSDDDMETLLGFDRTDWHSLEAEHPDILCAVHPAGTEVPRTLPEEIVTAFRSLPFAGTPNRLSDRPVNWEVIYEVAAESRKPRTEPHPGKTGFTGKPLRETAASDLPAARIIRQRRSAVSFSGRGGITQEQFLTMLDRTLPRNDCAPFDAGLGPPEVNLLLFVHRVAGLEPGLYFFIRTGEPPDHFQSVTAPDLEWTPVAADVPLYRLRTGDVRSEAISVSCHQDIAGFSAFSLGMIARFRETVTDAPYRYRHLFWETGMIGQVLYLEAEAHGVRGTGIGCFFDDPVHELPGLRDNTFQSLYHFTVGEPVEDPRLSTLPPYDHLKG